VTFASNDAQVWRVKYISGRTDSHDQIGIHRGLDAHLDAASIRPADVTRPTIAAHGAENVTATALHSNSTRAMAASRHCQPGRPKRRDRTVAGGWARTGKGTPCNRVPPFVRWRSRAGGLRVPSRRPLPFFAG